MCHSRYTGVMNTVIADLQKRTMILCHAGSQKMVTKTHLIFRITVTGQRYENSADFLHRCLVLCVRTPAQRLHREAMSSPSAAERLKKVEEMRDHLQSSANVSQLNKKMRAVRPGRDFTPEGDQAQQIDRLADKYSEIGYTFVQSRPMTSAEEFDEDLLAPQRRNQPALYRYVKRYFLCLTQGDYNQVLLGLRLTRGGELYDNVEICFDAVHGVVKKTSSSKYLRSGTCYYDPNLCMLVTLWNAMIDAENMQSFGACWIDYTICAREVTGDPNFVWRMRSWQADAAGGFWNGLKDVMISKEYGDPEFFYLGDNGTLMCAGGSCEAGCSWHHSSQLKKVLKDVPPPYNEHIKDLTRLATKTTDTGMYAEYMTKLDKVLAHCMTAVPFDTLMKLWQHKVFYERRFWQYAASCAPVATAMHSRCDMNAAACIHEHIKPT
jgi:hypothetical protein